MEHRLLSEFHRLISENQKLSPKSATIAVSLLSNSFTSYTTLSSLLDTLLSLLQIPNSSHHQIFALLSALSRHHPDLRHRVSTAAHSFVLFPSTPAPSLPQALSLLDSTQSEPFSDESLFLSLCFFQCVKTRIWTLSNLSRFSLRPSVFLMVLLGFTKDPYPYIRKAALDGLVELLKNGVVVEDQSLIEGCYFRAVELLFDAENAVRCSAVLAVSEWGKLLVALNPGEAGEDWSDALFLQLCSVARDMDLEVKIAVFTALGKIRTVSKDILLQTLSKKALASVKEKYYPGQFTIKLHKLPAYAATFTFVHGMEDEFYEVRRSACHALQMLTDLSAEFAGEAVSRLVDLLNDDSVVVRLQALESLHSMAINNHLQVEESHLHMFFDSLIDSNATVRSAARKALRLIKLQKLAMFKSCIDSLIKNLEVYPQDEADLFSVIFGIGRAHGKFMLNIIQSVSQELEPSFEGNLGFNKDRTAALLVLAISAPVSLERQICCIPPQIFSYAVTILGRVSRGLSDITDKDNLLAYMCHCSRFTFAPGSEFSKLEELDLRSMDVKSLKKGDEIFDALPLRRFAHPLHDFLLKSGVNSTNCVEIVFQKVVSLWPLIRLGCLNEILQSIRSWKDQLRYFTGDSAQQAGVFVFASKYLQVLKLLARAWAHYFSPKNFQLDGMGIPEVLLVRTERRLKELLQRFTGLSRETELNILELILVTYTLRLSFGKPTCFEACIKNMNSVLSLVKRFHDEGSVELSSFVVELQYLSHENEVKPNDRSIQRLDLLEKPLDLFSLRRFSLSQEVKYMEAKMHVYDNDFQNPLPFVSGLPVGIPFDITLYNVSIETRLWIAMALTEKSTQFVFVDLHEFGGSDEMRKFTFVAPFYQTPRVKYFSIRVSIAMESLPEFQYLRCCKQPKHELVRLCKEKEIHLSMVVRL